MEVIDVLVARGESLYLGRGEDGRPKFGGPRDHMLALGPPGCGKSSGLVVPSVAAHPGPVIVTSTRDDVVAATARARGVVAGHHGGRVLQMSLGAPDSSHSPIAEWPISMGCHDWDVALDRAAVLTRVAVKSNEGNFYQSVTADALASLLCGSAGLGEVDADLLGRIALRDFADSRAEIAGRYGENHVGVASLDRLIEPDLIFSEVLQNIFTTLEGQVLGALKYGQSPGISELLDLDELVRSWGTLYVTIPTERAEQLKPMVAALVEAATSAWRRSAPLGAPERGTLLLALDEVANISPIPNLPSLLTAGGGDGIQCLLGMQDPSQANVWEPQAYVITGGTTHLAVYPGLRHHEYLKGLTALGEHMIHHDFEVTIKENLPSGPRFANETRLIEERQTIEALRATSAPDQFRLQLRRLGQDLAKCRRQDRILSRVDEGLTTGDTVVEEIVRFTVVKTKAERRPKVGPEDIANAERGTFFYRGPSVREFRSIEPWHIDPLWRLVLLDGTGGTL